MATSEASLEQKTFNVLVTGASGYIASHVVKQLLEAGHAVRGTVRDLKDEHKVGHLMKLCPNPESSLELVEADLIRPDTWLPAVEGMDFVIHVASPYPSNLPETELEAEECLTKPAVQGTLNVLEACAKVTTVRRVVLTSSINAIEWLSKATGVVHTESHWSDPTAIDAYSRSKTLAENAAWDYLEKLPADRKLELVVLNPSMVMGPPLHRTPGTSIGVMQKLLDSLIPGVPKINYPLVDVRDVALAHVRAMTAANAAGHRHIIHNTNLWMVDMALLVRSVFKPRGYDIPHILAPNSVLKMASVKDRSLKAILPHLGLVHVYDNTRMRTVLGIEPRDIRETIIDMAHAMVKNGLAHREPKYRPPCPEDRDKYMAVKLKPLKAKVQELTE